MMGLEKREEKLERCHRKRGISIDIGYQQPLWPSWLSLGTVLIINGDICSTGANTVY